jgi:hypothetical protein
LRSLEEFNQDRLEELGRDKEERARRSEEHRRAHAQAYREKNRAAILEKKRQWYRETTSERKRQDQHFRTRYGITADEYDRMFEAQGGVCKICSKPETRKQKGRVLRLDVDHDPVTGGVRGLLCHKCNTGLGFACHEVQRLLDIIDYLGARANATLRAL